MRARGNSVPSRGSERLYSSLICFSIEIVGECLVCSTFENPILLEMQNGKRSLRDNLFAPNFEIFGLKILRSLH